LVFNPQADRSYSPSLYGVHAVFSFDFPGIHYISWLLEGWGWRRLQGWNISPRARPTLISQVLAGTSLTECAFHATTRHYIILFSHEMDCHGSGMHT
jgi:hypothetical protein